VERDAVSWLGSGRFVSGAEPEMGQHVAEFGPRCVFLVTARAIFFGYFATLLPAAYGGMGTVVFRWLSVSKVRAPIQE
jgi:hypothetical protein